MSCGWEKSHEESSARSLQTPTPQLESQEPHSPHSNRKHQLLVPKKRKAPTPGTAAENMRTLGKGQGFRDPKVALSTGKCGCLCGRAGRALECHSQEQPEDPETSEGLVCPKSERRRKRDPRGRNSESGLERDLESDSLEKAPRWIRSRVRREMRLSPSHGPLTDSRIRKRFLLLRLPGKATPASGRF
ncbi:hypothetical protein H8959_009584 [Pygathrix nigripes]